MSTKVRGYNIRLQLDEKYIAGATDDSFKITPEIEESLIKDDNGEKTLEVVDSNIEFTVTAKLHKKEAGEDTTHLDYTDLRQAAYNGTPFAFIYGEEESGDHIVTGNAIISDFSENTNAKDVGQLTFTMRTYGTITFTTVS